jgi:ubiquinone/menaquinone biosynthesis C-methylase UbiE
MDFEDGKFDAAVSSFMMDHMGEQKICALSEINRVLKPEGKFLLVVMVPGFFTFSIANFLCLVFISRKRWRKLFEECNFKLLDEGDFSGAAYFLAEKA